MRKILVLGATGFVGRALVPRLLEAGDAVLGGSRRPPEGAPSFRSTSAEKRPPPRGRLEWVRCDARVPSTLPAALDGVECAYYLVHGMGGRARDFRDTERRSARAFADAAAASACKRIVYLGGVAPSSRVSEHLASRLEVGEILRAGQVPAVELRAAMILGAGSASWQVMRDLAARLPMMLLPRWLESRCRPIAIADAVTALLDASLVPLDASKWFDIPGPDELSAREMLLCIGALRGRRIPALRVPALTPRLSALWLRLVTRADYHLARELVLGLTGDLLPCDERYWELTGHPPRVSFEQAARAALDAERSEPKGGALSCWEERIVDLIGARRATASSVASHAISRRPARR
jgi:uncharacterized protein YbjT (DUF2867 family)